MSTEILREKSAVWTLDDTEHWLTDYPLPATFFWNGMRAYPRYALKHGYGFWLRTAGPYYPALRGLFLLCHQVLEELRPGVDRMPDGAMLGGILLKRVTKQGELPWSDEDRATIRPGVANPAENAPGVKSDEEEEF